MTEGKKWTERLLEQIQNGDEPDEDTKPNKKSRRRKDNARRLTNVNL